MSKEDDFLIEDYFRDNLDQKQLMLLEQRKLDPGFMEKFVVEKQLFESMDEEQWSFAQNVDRKVVQEYQELFEEEDIKKLKSVLKDRTYESSITKPTQTSWKWAVYAAAAIGLILIGLSVFNQPNLTSEELYSNYLDKGQLTYSVVRGETTAEELGSAQQLFFNGAYKEALPLLQELIDQPASDLPALYLMKGVALTEMGEYAAASETFDELLASNFLDAQKAYWYKGLMLLKKGDIKNAQSTFTKIKEENLYNSEQAKAILKSLE